MSASAGPPPLRWEHFEHGADVGVRGVGPSRAAAFEQAALALTAVLTPPAGVAATDTVPIVCEAADEELLLLAWLNALVSEMALRRMVFGDFMVRITPPGEAPAAAVAGGPARWRLEAEARGERLDPARHDPAVEVKGATCTLLRVGLAEGGGWLAQTVVDV
jgi:tRNA nucleotidyltransferase (CCA-adding enzyme)